MYSQQIFESFGWLLLMTYLPFNSINSKLTLKNESENIFYYFILNFVYGILIIIVFILANYKFLALISIIPLILPYIIIRKTTTNETLISLKYCIVLTFLYCVALIYFKTFIYIISATLFGVMCFILYIHYKYVSIKLPMGKRMQFSYFEWIALPSIFFVLSNINVDLLDSINSETLYWFYSTLSQSFSAILGIIAMISIYILEISNKEKQEFILFRSALKGFIILFFVIIILSLMGILFVNNDFSLDLSLETFANALLRLLS